MIVKLTVIAGTDAGRNTRMESPGRYLIGRSKEAFFRLDPEDLHTSRKHFYVELNPPHCFVRNLSSKNPIKVNGIRTNETKLHDGDLVEAGFTKFLVKIDSAGDVRDTFCARCGKPMTAETSGPEICPACTKNLASLSAVDTDIAGTVLCHCGKDLTRKADSDGRMADLQDDVEYCCEECLPEPDFYRCPMIGEYLLLKQIGEGLMGSVYKVYHPLTARILALKHITDLTEDAFIKRFQREIFLLRNLRHPNLIRYVDSSLDAREPYLVMSYSCGGNLNDFLLENGPLQPEPALRYICDALRGMEYIHEHGIVHRDIKPENILLHPTLEGPVPKITDFGIAKQYTDAGGSCLTKSSHVLGTPFFMPPEQIIEFQNVREPGDLYSLGMTLYYIITGQLPYDFPSPYEIEISQARNRRSVKEIIDAVNKDGKTDRKARKNPFTLAISESPIPIRDRCPGLPRSFADVIDKSIRKDIEQRFQSAAEFRTALESVLKDLDPV